MLEQCLIDQNECKHALMAEAKNCLEFEKTEKVTKKQLRKVESFHSSTYSLFWLPKLASVLTKEFH